MGAIKLISSIIFSFLLLTGAAQSRDITLIVKHLSFAGLAHSDSLKIALANQGPYMWEEYQNLGIVSSPNPYSVSTILTIDSDSTALRIYFNKMDYVEIRNLDELANDSLIIEYLACFEPCDKSGRWMTKTTYENDSEGNRDPLNYTTRTAKEVDLDSEACAFPADTELIINGKSYPLHFELDPIGNQTKVGHGTTRRKWLIGNKRDFNFKVVSLDLRRVAEIELMD